jgi:hypothetical protein
MKKGFFVFARVLFFLVVIFFIGSAIKAFSEVRVNVNLGAPVVVSEPPDVVYAPDAGVYFVPSVDFDLFFFDGYWWSHRGPRWYRAYEYNGPWAVMEPRFIPSRVLHVRRNYRKFYVREKHIPFRDWDRGRARRAPEGQGQGGQGGGNERGHGEGRGEGRGR